MSAIKREAVKQSLLTSKHVIFEQAGVSGITRTTRCRILNTIGKSVKQSIHPPLTTRHRNQRLERAKKCARQTSRPFFPQMSAEQPSMDQMAGAEVGL